jgi:hypothetical protein
VVKETDVREIDPLPPPPPGIVILTTLPDRFAVTPVPVKFNTPTEAVTGTFSSRISRAVPPPPPPGMITLTTEPESDEDTPAPVKLRIDNVLVTTVFSSRTSTTCPGAGGAQLADLANAAHDEEMED